MGVSIYYSFVSDSDLTEDLAELSCAWSDEFEGEPYEQWCWYKPEQANGSIHYQGATQLPMEEESGIEAFISASALLSQLRRKVGGKDWSVSLDDMELVWNEEGEGDTPDL